MSPHHSSPSPQGGTPTVSAAVMAAQRALLDKLVACERRFADLYAACANSFLATSGFWTSLSKEETEHAAMLETMKRFVDAGYYFTNIGTLTKGVDSTLNELDHVISALKRGHLAETQAFERAIGFEARLVDGRFYDIVDCGAPEFHHMASVLRKGAELHRKKLHDRMTARRAETGESWKG